MRFTVRRSAACSVAAACLGLGVLAVPGSAAPVHLSVVRHRPQVPVTGHVRPLSDYVAQGVTPQRAALLAQLDHLAADGVSTAMLNGLATSAGAGGATVSSDGAPEPSVYLQPTENVDGRGTRDVLEERFLPGRNGASTLQVVAREGSTGRALWSRREAATSSELVLAVPSPVGAAQHAGVLVYRLASSKSSQKITLTALSGAGRVVWARSASTTSDPGGDGFTFLDVYSADLRSRVEDLVVEQDHITVAQRGSRFQIYNDSTTLRAVQTDTGALRSLPGSVSSPDGEGFATAIGDQSGDGLDDIVSIDAGAAHTVTVLRGSGETVWARKDIVMNGLAGLYQAGSVTGARAGGRPVEDLALSTAPAPGIADQVPSPITIGVPGTEGAQHGQVLLLAGGTGATTWTTTADFAYPLESAGGHPALGVLTDTSSESSSTTTSSARLDVLDAAGKEVWTKTYSVSVPKPSSGSYYTFTGLSFGVLVDLDGDGGLEGDVTVYAEAGDDASSTSTSKESDALVSSLDGARLKDTTSGFLFGSVLRSGQDRVLVRSTHPGLVVSDLRGRDSARRFAVLVPASQGVPRGTAVAAGLGTAPCADITVFGFGRGRAVVGVLASNGQPRWSVGRASGDAAIGAVHLARTAPRPRC